MTEKRLTFELERTEFYSVSNQSGQVLGAIERRRVGRFLHWCFLPIPVKELGDLWITQGCLKEISEKITELYRGIK